MKRNINSSLYLLSYLTLYASFDLFVLYPLHLLISDFCGCACKQVSILPLLYVPQNVLFRYLFPRIFLQKHTHPSLFFFNKRNTCEIDLVKRFLWKIKSCYQIKWSSPNKLFTCFLFCGIYSYKYNIGCDRIYAAIFSMSLVLRARRALSLFKDVPLRTRRALSPFKDCSVDNDKGIITIQRCSVENQKGTLATDFVQQLHPSGSQQNMSTDNVYVGKEGMG